MAWGEGPENWCQVRKWGGHPGDPGATRTQWPIPLWLGSLFLQWSLCSQLLSPALSVPLSPSIHLQPAFTSAPLGLQLSVDRLAPHGREYGWKQLWNYNLSA